MISWPSNEGKYSYKIIFWKEKKHRYTIYFFLLNWDWRMYYTIVDYNKKCKQNSSWKFCSNFFYSRLSKKPLFLYTPSYRQQGVWSLSLNNDCKYFLLIAHEMTMVWNSTSNKHNSRSNKKFMTQRILLWCSMSSILFLRRQNNIMKKITFLIILNKDHFYIPESSHFW